METEEFTPKILAVDDKKENLFALEKVLNKLDVDVICATSGNEALRLLLENEFMLALLDVMMPEMDGFETASLIQEDEKTKHMPIIFVTASAASKEKDYIYRGYESGAVDYLMKPVDTEILLSKVSVFLDLYYQKREIERLREKAEKANLELKKMNNQMAEFVGIVAHDLRGPVSNISFICDLLEETPDDLKQYLPMLKSSAQTSQDLISDFLDIASLSSGKVEIEKQRTVVSVLISQAIDGVKFKIDKKKLNINNSATKPYDVIADPKRILQVLDNLLSNAIKFTSPGGIITVHAIEEDMGIKIKVSDTGVGIEPDIQPKLFLKNEKVSTQGTDGEPGIGFGLPLSQELITAHGSSIEVSSNPGEGSTFSFVLPVYVEEE